LERLVNRYLKNTSLLTKPLTFSQYAYKKGRSTETTLHHLVNGVETQLAVGGYALGCFMDIEGAFDSISNKAISEAMNSHGVSAAIMEWTKDILTSRKLTVSYEGRNLEGRPIWGLSTRWRLVAYSVVPSGRRSLEIA